MNIYTTEQISELLGVPTGTIRVWKSRKPKADQLIEGTHWFSDNGATMWTEAGLEVLRSFKSKKTVAPRATATAAHRATSSVAGSASDYFEPLLEALADGLTPNLMNRLAGKVTQRLGFQIAQPCAQEVTIESTYEILACIGITPGEDPVTLLTGNGSSYLLEGVEDEED